MAWGGEGDVVDVDTGVDAGQDDTVGEDDQGSGDQGNGDNRDDRDDRGDANVQASDTSTEVDSAGTTAGIGYDFTPDKAKDRDEDSLIAYDRYRGDPSDRLESIRSRKGSMGDKSRFDPDTDDVVGAYVRAAAIREVDAQRASVMERASKSGPAQAERAGAPGAGYVESERVREQQRQGMIDDDISMVGYKEATDRYDAAQARVARAQAGIDAEQSMLETEQRDVRAQLEARRSLAASQLDPQVSGARTIYGSMQEKARMDDERAFAAASVELQKQDALERDARIMATERSNRAAAQERARLGVLEKQQEELANAQKAAVTENKINKALVETSQTKEIIAIDKLLANPNLTEKEREALLGKKERIVFEQSNQAMYDKLSELKDKIKDISTFKEGFWKGFTKPDNKTKGQVQDLLNKFYSDNKTELDRLGRKNSDLINAMGFSGVKMGLGGGMIFGAIQGLMNSLGIAYHKTDTEKELIEIMTKWGLIEKPRSDLSSEEQKTLCERKEGWEWDEDAQVCRMKSADRFSEDKRFVPQY